MGADGFTSGDIRKLDKAGGTLTGALVSKVVSGAPSSGYPIGQPGAVATGLTILSSFVGGEDDGTGTDSTGRVNLYSYQRAQTGTFGETIRNFLMRKDAKAMTSWYGPTNLYDGNRDPVSGSWRPWTWTGSHYEANDHSGIHGHWEIEVPDASGALQGRLEVPFIDQDAGTGAIGVAVTNIRTNLADFSVRAQATTDGTVNTALRVGGANAINKDICLSINSSRLNGYRRWILRANSTTEAGSNVGTDFQLLRYDDSGTFLSQALTVLRSNGYIGVGITAPAARLHIVQSGSQMVYLVAQAASQSALLVEGVDATVKALQAQVTGDTTKRFQVLTDGGMSWGAGATALDTTLYRSAAGALKTDGTFRATKLGAGVDPSYGLHVTASASGALALIDRTSTSDASPLLQVLGGETASSNLVLSVHGDTTNRFVMDATGKANWGDGTAARDTNLYRTSTAVLKTDGSLQVTANLRINTTSVAAGVGVVAIANAGTLPTATPSGGGVLYVSGGALFYKGSSGTATQIAVA